MNEADHPAPVGMRPDARDIPSAKHGGLAPLTVTWMIRHFDSRMMPAVYLIIAGVLSLVLVTGTRRVWLRGATVEAVPPAE